METLDAHLTTDPLTVEVAEGVIRTEVTTAQEASLVAIESR